MSDYPGMDRDELVRQLRSDLGATSAERDAAASQSAHEQQMRLEAEEEVAKLERAARDASTPDAQIRAGWHAIRQKFADLFKRD